MLQKQMEGKFKSKKAQHFCRAFSLENYFQISQLMYC